MGEMSPWHWLIVIGVAVLLFGARRLPAAARSLGQSARILRAELRPDAPGGTSGDGPADTSHPPPGTSDRSPDQPGAEGDPTRMSD